MTFAFIEVYKTVTQIFQCEKIMKSIIKYFQCISQRFNICKIYRAFIRKYKQKKNGQNLNSQLDKIQIITIIQKDTA